MKATQGLKPPAWDAPTLELLETVPGLRLNHATRTAFGLPDAIAAGRHLLKLPPKPLILTLPEVSYESLRPYQNKGVAELVGRLHLFGGALLADDLGLGKTRQALHVVDAVDASRVLIVCPAYVRRTWADEIRAIFPAWTIALLGPKQQFTKEWEKAHDCKVIIVSYELAEEAVRVAFPSSVPQCVIMDEAHYLGGRRTKRTKALQQICTLASYKLALTGTPIWSRPRDLYSLLNVLLGHNFGTASSFDRAYCGGVLNEFGGMDNAGRTREIELSLRLNCYMVRREKAEVLTELPPLTRQIVWVDPDPEAEEAFQLALTSGHSGAQVSKALQATLAGKVSAAVELAASAPGGRFLLFTYLKAHAAEITTQLRARGIDCEMVTGDLPADERATLCAQAQTRKCGIVATIDSLGAGVNLQGLTSYGIMHSIDWVPLKMIQAEGRLHRMGQTANVHWTYVAMRNTMDAVVIRSVVDKLESFRTIVGAGEATQAFRDDLNSYENGAGSEDLLRSIYEAFDDG